MSSLGKDKAVRYIGLLDAARCNGHWQEVPELVRKVGKHAPQRKCLILAAQSEYQVHSDASKYGSVATPSSPSRLAQLIPPLLTAVENERTFTQDAFQAQVCLGWIHSLMNEPGLAVSRLPRNFAETLTELNTPGYGLTIWSQTCVVKGAYIKSVSQERVGHAVEAVETMRSVLPLLSRVSGSELDSSEMQLWSEHLLGHLCISSSQLASAGLRNTSSDNDKTIAVFRLWANFWRGRPGQGSSVSERPEISSGISRTRVWKAYYNLLSKALWSNTPYLSTAAESEMNPQAARLQQSAELKRVEATYEAMLLKEVRFPKAHEVDNEITEWVELVMGNWAILCGPHWRDEDLGEGGKESIGRNVLDILYRAATRSFHSTPILRHLFTVHSSLTEFDLAFHAFDSYIEIVTRGKARAEKSGKPELGLDDDEIVLKTATEAVRVLCRFGARKEAEKARDLGITIETWLKKQGPNMTPQSIIRTGNTSQEPQESNMTSRLAPNAFAMAYRAIGLSQARWARVTYDAASRAEIQSHAITSLRLALSSNFEDEDNLETLFALGLLLAETRDLDGAILMVKHALSSTTRGVAPTRPNGTDLGITATMHVDLSELKFARERKLIPLWHLLALLLSARQDFDTATKSCEAAFEQFSDPTNLFGVEPSDIAYSERSDSSNEKTPKAERRGAVDEMDTFEKENVIQIKMTELALVEVSEGPEVAVNGSQELLSLYARLFGDQQITIGSEDIQTPKMMPPTQSSGGTVKSLKGSLFGHSKSTRQNTQGNKRNITPSGNVGPPVPSRPEGTPALGTHAPTIQITDNDSRVPQKEGHHGHLFHHTTTHHGERLHRRSGSLNRKLSVRSKRNSSPTPNTAAERNNDSNGWTPNSKNEIALTNMNNIRNEHSNDPETIAANRLSILTSPSQVGLAVSPDATSTVPQLANSRELFEQPPQSLAPAAHNLPPTKQPAPISHPRQQPNQDTRLPSTNTQTSSTRRGPRLPSALEHRHAVGVLCKVWLLIAGLYTRAEMYEDARGAIDEANHLVVRLEHEAAKDQSGSRAFSERGWGGSKSVDELWGDIWAERGKLAGAESSSYGALSHFEQALTFYPDHPAAIVGLSNILLDIYSQTIPPPSTTPSMAISSTVISSPSNSNTTANDPILAHIRQQQYPSTTVPAPTDTAQKGPQNGNNFPSSINGLQPSSTEDPTPEELDRLSARDRAYGLLSTITKLGSGWDYSEAWFALARAYEESGQLEKAKEVLWWVVELEDSRAVRGWHSVGLGSYVL
ncbi:MAG: hypothetical protein M1827_000508 [Pycnora praestabilis]|nr:MAG: hypothetical protein M1827_000508 [Pycnora praestabilis]